MKPKLRFNPGTAVAHLRANDTALAALIDRIGPFALELKPATSLFEALLRSIIYQQLHGKAAANIHQRVLAELNKHGGRHPKLSPRRAIPPCVPPVSPATNCAPSVTLPPSAPRARYRRCGRRANSAMTSW